MTEPVVIHHPRRERSERFDLIKFLNEYFYKADRELKGKVAFERPFYRSFLSRLSETGRSPDLSKPQGLDLWSADPATRPEERRFLSELICMMHPKDVHKLLGLRTLLWAVTNNRENSHLSFEALEYFESEKGIDKEVFKRALAAEWKFNVSYNRVPNTQTVAAQLVLARNLAARLAEQTDLKLLVKKTWKGPSTLTDTKLADFSLEPLVLDGAVIKSVSGFNKHWWQRRFPYGGERGEAAAKVYKIFHESPFGMLLTFKGEPLAYLCFHLKDSKTLFLRPPQGLRGTLIDFNGDDIKLEDHKDLTVGNRGLFPLGQGFRNILLEAVAQFARANKIQHLIMENPGNNAWIVLDNKPRPEAPTNSQAAEHINRAAKEAGFSLGKTAYHYTGSKPDWHLHL